MKSLFCILLLTTFMGGIAQTGKYISTKESLNKAKYACWTNRWQEAYSLFSKAKDKKLLDAVDYYLYAKSALAIGKEKHFTALMQSCLQNCGPVGYWMKKDISFFRGHLTKENTDSLINYFAANGKNCTDTTVMSFCNLICREDQDNRNGGKPDDTRDGKNQLALLAYIKKNGYPNSKIAGGDYLATVLLHINCELLEEYVEALLPEVLKGNLNPYYYAQMYDRIICNCKMGNAKYAAYQQPECPVPKDTAIAYRRKIGISIYLNGPASTPFTLGKETHYINDTAVFGKRGL